MFQRLNGWSFVLLLALANLSLLAIDARPAEAAFEIRMCVRPAGEVYCVCSTNALIDECSTDGWCEEEHHWCHPKGGG